LWRGTIHFFLFLISLFSSPAMSSYLWFTARPNGVLPFLSLGCNDIWLCNGQQTNVHKSATFDRWCFFNLFFYVRSDKVFQRIWHFRKGRPSATALTQNCQLSSDQLQSTTTTLSVLSDLCTRPSVMPCHHLCRSGDVEHPYLIGNSPWTFSQTYWRSLRVWGLWSLIRLDLLRPSKHTKVTFK
jgi:hypothetical protein